MTLPTTMHFCKNQVTNSTLGSQLTIRSLFHINRILRHSTRGSQLWRILFTLLQLVLCHSSSRSLTNENKLQNFTANVRYYCQSSEKLHVFILTFSLFTCYCANYCIQFCPNDLLGMSNLESAII